MFSSLRSRLLLTYVVVIGVALCVIALVTVLYVARNPSQTMQARLRLQTVSDTLERRVDDFQGGSINALKNTVVRVDEAFDVRVMFFSSVGRLLVDSRLETEPALLLESTLRSKRIVEFVRSVEDTEGNPWLYLAQPSFDDHWLVLATPQPRMTILAAIRSRSDEILRLLFQGGIAALIFSLIFAFWLTHWISAPLQRISGATQRIALGEYRPIRPEGPKEVKTLANAYNEMAKQVQTSQQSQRDFVANVSHELKTPLTSIQGFAQAIIDGTAQSPTDLNRAATIIHSEAERMHRMVLNLLDLARLDAGTFQFERAPVDLPALLNSVVTKITPQANEAQISIRLQVEPVHSMLADGDRLAQVFTNLLDNAIKHTPAGGEVRVTAISGNGWVDISVIDNGVGMSPEESSRIFERFYQVDKSRSGRTGSERGSGLGLAIAREIVEAHHGSISVHSQPGQGSIFVVKLPLVRPDDTTLATRHPNA